MDLIAGIMLATNGMLSTTAEVIAETHDIATGMIDDPVCEYLQHSGFFNPLDGNEQSDKHPC